LQGATRQPGHRRQTSGFSRPLMLSSRRRGCRPDACCYVHRRLGLGRYDRTRLVTVKAASGSSGDSERPPYEQARDELIELVKRLEAGGLTLEQSLKLWERGEELAAICDEWLEGARARLATALAQHQQDQHEPGAPF
jgi:exodeoxyribonuclease VII small subunit